MSIFFYNQYSDKLKDKVERTLSKYSGKYKKIAVKLIWWNLLFLFRRKKYNLVSSFNDDYVHIMFNIAGGIGDCIYNSYYIKAFKKYFGDKIVIDVLSDETFFDVHNFLFNQLDFVNNVVKESNKNYDLFINLIRFPKVVYFSAKRLPAKLLKYVEFLNTFYSANTILFNNDYVGRYYSLVNGRNRKTQADIDGLLNVKDCSIELKLLEDDAFVKNKFGLSKFNYITIQTGAGHHFRNIKNETRQWPIEYYSKLCKLLKQNYPNYKIVQIGVDTSLKSDEVDFDLLGKTTLSEMVCILKGAKLHISQEGGLPILRSVLNTGPSVVLFGPTDENFFGIDGNINISVRKCPGCCEWLARDWMKKCIKTNGCAECMQNISPEYVFENIKKGKVL